MTHHRTTPDPDRSGLNEPAQIGRSVVNLLRKPNGARDRQLLIGADVTILWREDGWAYVQSAADGYCGYVGVSSLTKPQQITHKVIAAASHGYQNANIKAIDRCALSHGSRLAMLDDADGFIRTSHGFVPKQHITTVDLFASDPADVAALYLDTPYLWGGNSRLGGELLEPGTAPQRNDLLFWKGHVALVWDEDTLIHANGHAMATVFEPIKDAIARIAATDGEMTAHRRLPTAD